MNIFNFGDNSQWEDPTETKLEEFNAVVDSTAKLSNIEPFYVKQSHGDVINFAIISNRDLAPGNWEHYRESRRASTFFIPETQFPNTQTPFIRPTLEHDANNLAQAILNKKTRYTSVPVYHVDEFGNRQSRSCNNDLKTITPDSLAFFGCSFTYGDCLDGDSIYVNKVADGFSAKLNRPVTAYNLGYGANSIESIRQQFQATVSLRSFTYAFFLLPMISRFNVIEVGKNGEYLCNIVRNMSSELPVINKLTVIPSLNEEKMSKRVQRKIESTNLVEEIFRAVDNIKMILTLCKLHNIRPIFSAWDRETYTVMASALDDLHNQLAPWFFHNPENLSPDPMGFASDGMHPGPGMHDRFAQHIVNWLQERNI